MIRTIVIGNGISMHFQRGCGLARGQATEEEGLCGFAKDCNTYHIAVRIIQSRRGEVSNAVNQIYYICRTNARKEQLCYLERREVN